ncbi:uncharacterized protein L203_102756 [Cryptococcus depauperatus CBS 7841]|uniref:DNA polymerase kappa n=1 Tax=Cryptococcus depauperatus CBS 7841 TaxID=1295531 RepID=A0AAJ8JSB8_9TREE
MNTNYSPTKQKEKDREIGWEAMTRPWQDMADEEKAEAERKQRSFERSLAGPSVGKAGLVRDQTEINKIIAEASKGSKFYNNQVRKDKELTEKIAWYQTKRDELMRMASRDQLEADADRILVEEEMSRDLTQTIIHVDMDAFYASVEVQRDPSLKNKAFGVGRGVLTTASYEARKFGVRSGMAGFIAKKLCPNIILTDTHFDLYIAASKSVREILEKYDENLMMASLDEGYLNITPYMSANNMSASDVVTQLRNQVEKETNMTISAGIAPNRMLAKICSDKNKPNGQYEMDFERSKIVRFMRDLPVRKIPGFGRVTERYLESLGVKSCGDIYDKRAELLVMNHWLGFRGLCRTYLGIADNNVTPRKREERKSVGVERTFRNKTNDEDIMNTLSSIVDELERDLGRLRYVGKTITVKFKLHTYENKTRAKSVSKFVSSAKDILPIAQDLLQRELPLCIRLLGVRLSSLKDVTAPEKSIKGFFLPQEGTSQLLLAPACIEATNVPQALNSKTEDSFNIPAPPEIPTTFVSKSSRETSQPNSFSHLPMNDHCRSSSSPCTDTSSPASSLVCPICGEMLPVNTSNQELNAHVDWCLNRVAIIKETGRSSHSGVKKRGMECIEEKVEKRVKKDQLKAQSKGQPRATNGTISEWLRKGR